MKTINLMFLCLISLGLCITSCTKDDTKLDDDNTIVDLSDTIVPMTVQYGVDVIADTGNVGIFTYYNLSENAIVSPADSATTNWDLAFSGTTIRVNGGTSGPGQGAAQVVNGIFDELTEAPTTEYDQDDVNGTAIATGSGNGWYNYTSSNTPAHSILPIAGKIIVIKTVDEKYAKLEILSYYKGNPNTTTDAFAALETRPVGRHYNFKFVYQPDGSTNLANE